MKTLRMTRLLPALALVGSAGLVGCDDAQTVGASIGELSFSTTNVDFGEVQIGTSSGERTVLVRNVGTAPITIEGVVPGNPFDTNAFAFDFGDLQLPPNDSTLITVLFTPSDLGRQESVIIVRTTILGEPQETAISLTGEGVTSQLVDEPSRIQFGNVLVDTTKTIPVELTNNPQSRADIQFLPTSNMTICGNNDPAVFCVQPVDRNFREDEAFTLGSGESIELEIVFG